MAKFDLSRIETDPTYAPGRVITKGASWWRPTAADVKAGCEIRAVRLSGSEMEQAAQCRELTKAVLAWRPIPETWRWASIMYRTDDLSPIWDVKDNTRQSYLEILGWIEADIGTLKIAETDFAALKRWKRDMEHAGRSGSYVHRVFSHLRILANYGLAVKPRLFRDVCDVLRSGALKIHAPKGRQASPTADQVMSVISAADAAGEHGFALGIALQWWLALRAVDVRGQWLPYEAGKRWADGMTWDMVDLKSGTITKSASKTERYDGVAITWDLNPIPGLLDRIASVPEDERVGPVIKRKGRPFDKTVYSGMWRRFAREVGIPDEVQMRDTRAGAINDAMLHGASKLQLQHAAGHLNSNTTERYIRAREQSAQTVIQFRAGK